MKKKGFTFLHTGDNHLGHSGNASRYNEYASLRIERKNEEGIPIRQQDINLAFQQVMDLAIEKKVDAVLNAGDLFDFWGYKAPEVLTFAVDQIKRLEEHGILFICIIGNHDLPKQKGKGTYLKTLSYLPNVRSVYQGFYEKVTLEEFGVVLHCVPSTFSQDLLMDSLDEIKRDEGYINIGMAHLGVTVIDHYRENALNSLVVDLDTLRRTKMDYFALADYHETKNLAQEYGEHIWYCGSSERMGFGEIHNTPQVLHVTIPGAGEDPIVTPIPLDVRPMIELESVDAENKSIEDINSLIIERIKREDVTDKIVRLRVKHLPTHLKKFINDEEIRELTDAALYFKFELTDKVTQTKGIQTREPQLEGVIEGWGAFVDEVEQDASYDREKLRKIGYERLQEALEEIEQ